MKQVQAYKTITYRWVCPYCGSFNETEEDCNIEGSMVCSNCIEKVEYIELGNPATVGNDELGMEEKNPEEYGWINVYADNQYSARHDTEQSALCFISPVREYVATIQLKPRAEK